MSSATTRNAWRGSISREVAQQHEQLVAVRRDLHRHPELGFREHRTAAIVAARLRELGADVREGVGRTGVVGVLTRGAGPVVLHRADMDALPLEEAADREHRSEFPGVMHACGHDAHVAIGLGLGTCLAGDRSWKGTVVLCFQPAEEGDGGAAAMIADGLLEDPVPDSAFALHVLADLAVGRISVPPRAAFAGCRDFDLVVEGRGGHAAMPHQALDPIACACAVVTELQSVVARRIDPLASAVLTVGKLEAGTARNVIPSSARMSGTMRSHDPAVLARLAEELERVVAGTCAAHACTPTLDVREGYPVVINDSAWAKRVHAVADGVVGAAAVGEEVVSGSEDMSHVLERVPGCYYLVGAGVAGRHAPHHSPDFDLDEDCLLVGTELARRVVLDALGRDRGPESTREDRNASVR